MFRRLTQVNQSRRTRQEYSWQPAGYSAEEFLNKLDEGWFAGLQKGAGKAHQPCTLNLNVDATAGTAGARPEAMAVPIQQSPLQMQGQEVESAPQTNTVVSLAGAGAPSPADGGAQPAANPVPQAGATQQATAAVQTESSVGRDQPAALVSTSMQTLSQAEQDLDLAQQGRLPLPEADFKLCRVITGCLRRATEQARQGFIMEAERNVCMALDNHEEELLVMFGNVPLQGYRMGTFVDVCSLVPTPEAALQQSQRLLQDVPGHFLGQLGKALSASMLDDQHNGEPLLQPVNLAPGPLGMASAANGMINVIHNTLQLVKVELKNANRKAVDSVSGMSASAGSGYQQVKEIQEELHRQHGATMCSIRGQDPREWFASFKAVGNMVVGNFSQAQKVCRGYLEQYKGQGYPLWAHMLKCYAQMHDTHDHHEIQQIVDELRRVVRHARQASVVHLAPQALPNMPTDVKAYIQSIEDTASAATQLVRDFDTVNELAGKLETQREWMTQEEVNTGFAEGRAKCSQMLDSTYAGHALSVRLIGRVYGLRALFHLYARDYILADCDSAYALSLNPHQCQVLAYWLLILNLVEADKAMSCVVSIAKEAIAHCSGEECARDEAGRQEQVDHFERQLQTLLAARGAAGFDTLMCEDKWRSFCGQNRKNGQQYLLKMSPDKVNARAGDFGDHMGLKLAYLPQLITSNMADHYEAMRENQREHHSSFPANLQGERPHADLSVVLGYARQPPTGQTCEDEDIHMEDASNVPDANHCQDSAPTSSDSSCSARDSPGQHFSSECSSQAHSPGCSSTGSFEDGSDGTGAFSPVYVATSPSFSPRGSQEGSEGTGAFSPVYVATSPSFSPRGSPESPPSQPAAAEQPPICADKAGTARPTTARGPGNTQQHAGRSAFCFARPARPQAPPAVDAQDAAEQKQFLAAGCGSTAESTAQHATAHHSAADAVLSEVASRLQQAEAEQVQAIPSEGLETQAVQAEAEEEQAALSEGMQTQGEAMQTDGMPSDYAQAEGSFFASSSPPHSFATSTPTHTFGGFQAGGEQPNHESGGAPSRRPVRRSRQAGGARRPGKAAH